MISPRFYFVRADPFEREQPRSAPLTFNPRNTSGLLRSHSSSSSSLLVFTATSRCALNIVFTKFGRIFRFARGRGPHAPARVSPTFRHFAVLYSVQAG